MPVSTHVRLGDIRQFACDILVLKYAAYSHGADLAVADALGVSLATEKRRHRFVETSNRIEAKEVLVIGVGSLMDFEYLEISEFGRAAIEIIRRERPEARTIGITIHGTGYGLDLVAVSGSLRAGLTSSDAREMNAEIHVVTRDKRQFDVLRQIFSDKRLTGLRAPHLDPELIDDGGRYGKRLFAAMPFDKSFDDHWDFAILPSGHNNGLLIERLDHQFFTGDIVSEIRNRIDKSNAVVALLDQGNPNVFLEVGYAWGVGKPTILILHEAATPPFDVISHKMIRYGRIRDLRDSLDVELAGLKRQGVF